MSIKNDLQIILVTFNRKKFLQRTFDFIFANNSPIKDFDITILDNASTDGTSKLCEEYSRKYENFKHIRHNKNIGGNANIVRAYEMANKKYIWVLCDDEIYDWSNWKEIESAIQKDFDIILTIKGALQDKNNLGQLFVELTFVPSAIYKTKHLTNTTLVNMYYGISNIFPQLALASKVLNDNGKIYVPLKNTVKKIVDKGIDNSYIRGASAETNIINSDLEKIFFEVGYLNSTKMLKDEKNREQAIEATFFNDRSLKYLSMHRGLRKIVFSNALYHNNYSKNICDIMSALNFKNRMLFRFILFYNPFKPYFFQTAKIGDIINIKLLGFLKLKYDTKTKEVSFKGKTFYVRK